MMDTCFLGGCDVCGGDHSTEACPELGLESTGFEDAVITRARLTLPYFAEAVDCPNGEVAVIAQANIPRKSQFGPFEAKKTTHEFSDDGLFVLKIFVRDGTSVSLDTTDENECNWMSLIRTASSQEEQNCMAYQLGTSIYYNTIKDIVAGQELLVWYAPQYARKLGKSITPDGVSKVMLNMKVIYPSVDELPESQPFPTPLKESSTQQPAMEETLPASHETRMERSTRAETDTEANTEKNLSQQDVLAAADFDDIPVWKCKTCSSTFNYEKEFAKHIMEHLSIKPPSQNKRGRPRKKPLQEVESVERTENIPDMEVVKEEEFLPESKSFDMVGFYPQKRIQPKRSLKGRRSEGYMADFIIPKKEPEERIEDAGVEELEEGHRQEVPKMPSPKRGRGRPRKSTTNTATPKVLSTASSISTLDHKVSTASSSEESISESPEAVKQTAKRGQKSSEKVTKKEMHKESSSNEKHSSDVTEQYSGVRRKRGRKGEIDRQEDSVVTVVRVECPSGSEKSSQVTESSVVGVQSEEDKSYRVEIEDPLTKKRKVEMVNIGMQVVEGSGKPEKISDTPAVADDMPEVVDSVPCNVEISRGSAERSEGKDNDVHQDQEARTTNSQKSPHLDSSEMSADQDSTSELYLFLSNEDAIEDVGANPAAVEDQDRSATEPALDTDALIETLIGKTDTENNPEETYDIDREVEGENNKEGEKNEEEENDKESEMDENGDEMESHGKKKNKAKGSKNSKFKHVCPYCKKSYSSKHNLKLHLPRHTGKFKCNFCGFFYARKENLMKHDCKMKKTIIEVPGEKVTYQCLRCDERLESIEDARQHFAAHSKELRCNGCGEAFASRNQYNEHVCPKQKEFACEICKQKFSNQKSLLHHVAMHTDIFKCNGCDKSYARKDSLIKHMLVCCPDRTGEYEVFACKKCKKGFATKQGVDNHEIRCTKAICVTCQKVFQSSELLDQHVLTCDVEDKAEKIRYSCTVCHKSFRNQAYLKRHLETHTGNFKCSTCNKVFNGKDELLKHERFCLAEEAIKAKGSIRCDVCSEEFDNVRFYKDHYITHTHPYHCDKCGKYFMKIGTLHTHFCQNATKSERCPICSKTFSSQKYCQIHQKVQHNITLHCMVCDMKFEEKKEFLYHMCRDEEGNPRPFNKSTSEIDKHVCHLCGRDFVSTSNLNKHMKIHGEKNVECPICHKKFHHAEYLKVHIEGKHEKRQKFQCSTCGKILTSKPGLITHVKNFHTESKVVYPCPKCGKIFSQKGNMRTHMYSHSAERAFACQHCPKTFKFPDQLNRHLLVHTMDQKLECDLCSKQFTKEYDLRQHKETVHSGLLYICTICKARCGHRQNLIRHYKRKHPEHVNTLKNDDVFNPQLQSNEAQLALIQVAREGEMEPEGNDEAFATTEEVTQDEQTTVVSQVAAEALQSLSSAIIPPEVHAVDVNGLIGNEGTIINIPGLEGSYHIQSLPQEIGDQGQGDNTVVILQIVNAQDGDGLKEYQVQEVVETTDIPAEAIPEDVNTYVDDVEIQNIHVEQFSGKD